MKKLISLTIVIFMTAAILFAGGIENNVNFNAWYLMNPSRNTEANRADAVFYNPAGTAFMQDGLYLGIGNQFILKNYKHTITDAGILAPLAGRSFNSDNPVLLYPNAHLVFKRDNYALFAAFGVFGGGGSLEFNDGTYLSNAMLAMGGGLHDHSFDLFSVTLGQIFGASVKINDMISVAAAVRFIQSRQTLEATSTGASSGNLLRAEASGNGVSGILGVHFRPIDRLDLSATYQTITRIQLEYTRVDGSLAFMADGFGIKKGNKTSANLPAVLGLGVGYRILENLYASLSFNYYYNKQADLISMLGTPYKDSWEIAAGVDYDFSDIFSFSLGTLFTRHGISKTANMPEAPNLNSFSIAAGTSIRPIQDLTIDIAAFKPFFSRDKFETSVGPANLGMDLERTMIVFGIGVTYKIF
ncbi:MAG: outer membrane protein transport protein [Spirochaetes bacterium]|nr:outer membrane protein transport protein [Spirochaetota bacterium]